MHTLEMPFLSTDSKESLPVYIRSKKFKEH